MSEWNPTPEQSTQMKADLLELINNDDVVIVNVVTNDNDDRQTSETVIHWRHPDATYTPDGPQ